MGAPTSSAQMPPWPVPAPFDGVGRDGPVLHGPASSPAASGGKVAPRRRWRRRFSDEGGNEQPPSPGPPLIDTYGLFTSAPDAEFLREGMAIFRGLLSPTTQQWLADLFLFAGDSGQRGGFGCFNRRPDGRLVLNYGHRAQYVDELAEFPPAMRALQAGIRSRIRDAQFCGDAPASVAIVNYYGGASSGMGWHVDADTDPPHVAPEEAHGSAVVSLSIGDACDFCYRPARATVTSPCRRGPDGKGSGKGSKAQPMQQEHRLRLESGDVLVFGGPSRDIEHCVDGLHGAGSRPPFLRMLPGRLNITFRNW